ncbi:MAG: PH domain-containing protein, partial [Acidobacteria bacterium]|nr:PH domain-containing protein [Acidobacteriota bacterium]
GSENSDEAIFCLKCGNKFDGVLEEETEVAKRSVIDDDEEEHIFSIRPTLLFVKAGYVLAAIGAFFIVAIFGLLSQLINYQIPYWFSIPAGLSLLLIPAYFHLKQKMVHYTLTDSKICIDEGLISKTTRNVPLRIIQDVTVSANFFQRALGFGNLEIENANENDGKILLKNIDSPKNAAETLLKQMRRLNK